MKCAYWNIRSNVSPGALHLLLFTSPKIYPSTLWKEDLKQLEIFCRKFGLCDVYGCYLVYVIYFKFSYHSPSYLQIQVQTNNTADDE